MNKDKRFLGNTKERSPVQTLSYLPTEVKENFYVFETFTGTIRGTCSSLLLPHRTTYRSSFSFDKRSPTLLQTPVISYFLNFSLNAVVGTSDVLQLQIRPFLRTFGDLGPVSPRDNTISKFTVIWTF